MGTRSKLALGLAAEKGIDIAKIKQKRRVKAVRKEKEKKKGAKKVQEPADESAQWEDMEDEDEDEGEEEEGEDEEEEGPKFDLDELNDSESSESDVEMEEPIPRPPKTKRPAAEAKNGGVDDERSDEEEEEEEEEEEDEEDIPMSDIEELSDADREDLIPHARLTINNTAALLTSLNRIKMPTDSSVAFATHQSITSATPTADAVPDVSDDLQRELQFYKQSRDAVLKARTLLRKEKVPFSRPTDYFAEMVKGDEHVEKIRTKLVEEASAKKASAEARKLRDLKKFGKQVQVAKLQERQKAKKESLEKIKSLKRKRQEGSGNLGTHEADDLFDVAVDNELGSGNRKPKTAGKGGQHVPNPKRAKKNEKYGFGGKKRHAKSGDAISSGDLSGFSVKKNRASFKGRAGTKVQRPGKARRKAMSSRG